MELRPVYDVRYSSHVNATAGPGSDDDTIFIFIREDHKTELPFSSNRDPEIRISPERVGIPFWKHMRDLILGHPLAVDLLFLPENAYLVRPPAILWDHRQLFVTRATFQAYLRFADIKHFHSTLPGRQKAAYHSLIYLNSARRISRGLPPAFLDPPILEELIRVRNSGPDEAYQKLYKTLRSDLDKVIPDLPTVIDWRLANTIYDEVMRTLSAKEDVGDWKPTRCGGVPEAIPAGGVPAADERANWWNRLGPILWKELHQWALGKPPAESVAAYLKPFGDRIPCGSCKDHWLLMLERTPAPSDPELLFEWTVDRHNEVNARLDKPPMKLEDALRLWAA